VRGRTIFFAVLAALSLLCGTAVAKKHHRAVHGSKHADHMKFGKADNRVFAGGGNDTVLGGAGRDRLRGGRGDDVLLGGAGGDRLRGGQDDDVMDGGAGDDVINARGDGGDPDEVVCGEGEDTVLLGRNDRIVVEAGASTDEREAGDDECEHVKRPDGPTACDSNGRGCDEGDDGDEACAATSRDCDEPVEEPCVATGDGCDDPVTDEPEPDEPVEEPEPGSAKLY
jgi:RTX calcium-binding nonapeptide repeat (4 copies)